MTKEEAIKELKESHDIMRSYDVDESESRLMIALDMAIKSLKYDDAKYHAEHGEVIVDKAVWEDAERALEFEKRITPFFCEFIDAWNTIKGIKFQTKVDPKYCDRNICLRNEYAGISCDECEVTKSQEPCEDAISRQAVQDYIAKYLSQYLYNDVREAVEVIDEYIGELPSVKPQEKTGHWIENAPEHQNIDPLYICSECGNPHLRKTDYCDQCGTKMVKEQESEDT